MRLVPVNKGRDWDVDIGMPHNDEPHPCRLVYCNRRIDVPKGMYYCKFLMGGFVYSGVRIVVKLAARIMHARILRK